MNQKGKEKRAQRLGEIRERFEKQRIRRKYAACDLYILLSCFLLPGCGAAKKKIDNGKNALASSPLIPYFPMPPKTNTAKLIPWAHLSWHLDGVLDV